MIEIQSEGASTMSIHSKSKDRSKSTAMFPYTFLLRWSWPEHIDRQLRRLMWLWLQQAGHHSASEPNNLDEFERLGGYVCWMIAVHPEAPPAVLDVLANQSSEAFSERVAEHPRCWPPTLAKLAKHPSVRVRIAVASNHNTPAESVALLAQDESPDVRFAVAESTHLPTAILTGLIDDDNCHVAARSRKTLAKREPESAHILIPKPHHKRAVGAT